MQGIIIIVGNYSKRYRVVFGADTTKVTITGSKVDMDYYKDINIWSNIMRTHIGLKICHFLQSVVSITEGPKNKIIRKSGIHSSVPCRDSTLEQFLFYRVSRKNEKSGIFWSRSYSTIHPSKQYFSHKKEAPRKSIF